MSEKPKITDGVDPVLEATRNLLVPPSEGLQTLIDYAGTLTEFERAYQDEEGNTLIGARQGWVPALLFIRILADGTVETLSQHCKINPDKVKAVV